MCNGRFIEHGGFSWYRLRDARTAFLTRGEGKAVLHNRPRDDVKRPCPGIS